MDTAKWFSCLCLCRPCDSFYRFIPFFSPLHWSWRHGAFVNTGRVSYRDYGALRQASRLRKTHEKDTIIIDIQWFIKQSLSFLLVYWPLLLFFSKFGRLCAVEKVFHPLVTRVTVRGHFSVALLWLFHLIPMYICNNAVNGTCCILFWNYYTFKEKEIVYFHPI